MVTGMNRVLSFLIIQFCFISHFFNLSAFDSLELFLKIDIKQESLLLDF